MRPFRCECRKLVPGVYARKGGRLLSVPAMHYLPATSTLPGTKGQRRSYPCPYVQGVYVLLDNLVPWRRDEPASTERVDELTWWQAVWAKFPPPTDAPCIISDPVLT